MSNNATLEPMAVSDGKLLRCAEHLERDTHSVRAWAEECAAKAQRAVGHEHSIVTGKHRTPSGATVKSKVVGVAVAVSLTGFRYTRCTAVPQFTVVLDTNGHRRTVRNVENLRIG